MPKTQDAFAFRELYQNCFQFEGYDSADEVVDIHEFYLKFLLKGFIKEYLDGNSYVEKARREFHIEQYRSSRAKFLANQIKHHIERLNRLSMHYDFFNPINERIHNLRKKYVRLGKDFEESAVNLEQNAINAQIKLRQILRQEFGKRLKFARRDAGYTGVAIAKYLGISQNSYSQYETGQATPPLSTIYLLAKKFNVSTDYLFCMDG